MSTDLTGTPPAPVVRTEVGNGRGSLIVGLTVVAIALFSLVILATGLPAHMMAWFAPTALITAGVFGLVQRR
ncbi:MAG TPA: hypothetical protein VIM10_06720 [Actinopolymorphaceae bacterium]|jgi:hypothetical protein